MLNESLTVTKQPATTVPQQRQLHNKRAVQQINACAPPLDSSPPESANARMFVMSCLTYNKSLFLNVW